MTPVADEPSIHINDLSTKPDLLVSYSSVSGAAVILFECNLIAGCGNLGGRSNSSNNHQFLADGAMVIFDQACVM